MTAWKAVGKLKATNRIVVSSLQNGINPVKDNRKLNKGRTKTLLTRP